MPDASNWEVQGPPVLRVGPRLDPGVVIQLLNEWMQGDESEQRETFEALRRALDETRPAGYKFFS